MSYVKLFGKSVSKHGDGNHDYCEDEGCFEKKNTISDKDRYPTANDHIFWTELGFDPK